MKNVKYLLLASIIGLTLIIPGAACRAKDTPATTTTPPKTTITITSSAFAHNGSIPVKYTCQGDDISPPLAWMNVPAGTKSLALIVDDTDARLYTHWVIFNIPPGTRSLPAGIPRQDTLADGSLQGFNSAKTLGYAGPCPPVGAAHHYRFRLYALDIMINLPPGADKSELVEKMTGHIINEEVAELIGTYQRQ